MTQMSFSYSLGLRTDVGQQRSLNEDTGVIFELPGTDAAFVVCDGMGGMQAGDRASKEAARVVEEALRERFGHPPMGDPDMALKEAMIRANDAVNAANHAANLVAASNDGHTATSDDPTERREEAAPAAGLMGTTCVAGIVMAGTLYLAHAGDSRAYRLRGGELTRLTEDHSFVAERVKAGDMTEAEAKVSRFRNMITRAIGIDVTVEPELRREPLAPGDTILVCSDGLTNMVDDDDIAAILNSPAIGRGSVERAASALVDAANKKGGHDNITALLVRVSDKSGNRLATSNTSTSGIMDMDAPRKTSRQNRSRGTSRPSRFPLLLLGAALALLILAGALAAWRPLREQVISLLGGSGVSAAQITGKAPVSATPSSQSATDFGRLTYGKPEVFAPFLARGDLLTFSKGVGLYFVADTSGKVALLSRTGKILGSVADLEVAAAPPGKDPTAGRMFMTSDAQGNVYLAYTKRKTIEKKGPDGRLLLTLSDFERPEAVAVDDEGNLYVVDFNQIKILRAHLPVASSIAPAPVKAAPTSPAKKKPRA